MKSLFMSFLVFIMIFSVFGAKIKYLVDESMRDILNLKEDFKATTDIAPEMEDMDASEMRKTVIKRYSVKDLPKDLDPEVQAMIDEIRQEQIIITNPLVEKFKDIGKSEKEQEILSDPRGYSIGIIQNFEKSNYSVGIVFFAVSAIIFLLVFITSGGEASGIGFLLAKLGFTISRILIFLGALSAVSIWMSLEYNIFMTMGSILLWGPFSVMIFSAISLKVYDFNNPVWNRMFTSTIWPIVSGLIIHAM